MRVRLGPRTGPAHACRAGSRYGTSTPCLAVAGEGVEVDLLDAGNVHRHVADVADEAQAVSIRGQVDPLGEVGADERHVSVPPWPSTVSLPSPGSQAKVSSPAPSSDRRRP